MPPAEASTDIHFVNPYIWGRVGEETDYTNITENQIKEYAAFGNKLIAPKQDNAIYFSHIDPSLINKPRRFFYAFDASYGPISAMIDIATNFNVTTSADVSIVNLTGIGPDPIPYMVYIHHNWLDVSTLRLLFTFPK
jgi:hypothetical protein